jgi:N-carbamoylputrescine amidase
MKATITQIDAHQLESEWAKLIDHIRANNSQLVLLPEMTFSEWFCTSQNVDDGTWQKAIRSHDNWLERLPELDVNIIMGTAPRNIGDKKHNVAYVWTADTGIQWIHSKTYLPNDDGYWEP